MIRHTSSQQRSQGFADRRRRICTVGCAAAALLVGCGGGTDTPATTEPGLANPASVYCVEQGGQVDIVDEALGQVGYCVLPDGRRVEEWEFYRTQTRPTPGH